MDKVLYVDDEFINLRLFEMNFRDQFAIITQSNPVKAIDTIIKEDIKVVITDYKMPEMNGMQLIEKIKLHDSKIVCLILTGFVEVDVLVDKTRVHSVTLKPFQKPDLVLKLKEAFEYYNKSA